MSLNGKSPGHRDIKVVLFLISMLLVAGSFTRAQTAREYADQANGFKITLVGNWRAEPYTDAVGRRKTEFVYETRELGLLRITMENLSGRTLQDVVRREIDDFTLCHSCVFTGQEAFAGSLTGSRVAHYYIEGGRRITGTFYFLRDKEAVWILRFSGKGGSPGMDRELTDRMARSFCFVCGL